MFCYQCGNQVEDESRFCPRCGAKLTAPPQVLPDEPLVLNIPVLSPEPEIPVAPVAPSEPVEAPIPPTEPLFESAVPEPIIPEPIIPEPIIPEPAVEPTVAPASAEVPPLPQTAYVPVAPVLSSDLPAPSDPEIPAEPPMPVPPFPPVAEMPEPLLDDGFPPVLRAVKKHCDLPAMRVVTMILIILGLAVTATATVAEWLIAKDFLMNGTLQCLVMTIPAVFALLSLIFIRARALRVISAVLILILNIVQYSGLFLLLPDEQNSEMALLAHYFVRLSGKAIPNFAVWFIIGCAVLAAVAWIITAAIKKGLPFTFAMSGILLGFFVQSLATDLFQFVTILTRNGALEFETVVLTLPIALIAYQVYLLFALWLDYRPTDGKMAENTVLQ